MCLLSEKSHLGALTVSFPITEKPFTKGLAFSQRTQVCRKDQNIFQTTWKILQKKEKERKQQQQQQQPGPPILEKDSQGYKVFESNIY